MRQIIALLLLLPLVGCSFTKQPIVPIKQVVHLNLLIEEEDTFFSDIAKEFAKNVYTLSKGTLQINPVSSGSADLCFVDSHTNHTYSRYFPLLCTPFLYPSYEAFSSRLNHTKTLSFLEMDMRARSGTVPLAALYTGSDILLTHIDKVKTETTEDAEKPEVISFARRQEEALSVRGLQDFFEPIASERIAKLLSKDIDIAEFTYEELKLVDTDLSDLHYMRSTHNCAPKWLLADAKAFDELSGFARAALLEACANLLADVDSWFLQKEEEKMIWLESMGVTSSELLLNNMVQRNKDLDPEEAHLIRLVQGK